MTDYRGPPPHSKRSAHSRADGGANIVMKHTNINTGALDRPAVGRNFWRGCLIGLVLNALIIALAVVAWRFVLWLV